MRRFTLMQLAVVLGLAGIVGGCNTPSTYSRGRVDPYETTRGEIESGLIQPTALMEFSDQVAMQVPQWLAEVPSIRQANRAGERVIVFIGDFDNKTNAVPTADFEVIAQRARSALLNSSSVRDKVAFREKRARMTGLGQRENVPTGQEAATGTIDPTLTYFLSGDFYRISRPSQKGDTNQYYMQFQLVHALNNEIVGSTSVDVKQFRK